MFKDKLNEDIPLPRPDKMTLGQISAELSVRGLVTTGSRQELNARLEQDDLSKKFTAKFWHHHCLICIVWMHIKKVFSLLIIYFLEMCGLIFKLYHVYFYTYIIHYKILSSALCTISKIGCVNFQRVPTLAWGGYREVCRTYCTTEYRRTAWGSMCGPT